MTTAAPAEPSPEPGGGRLAALPPPIRAAIWMTLAAVGFSCMIGLIRHVSATGGIHAFEIAFFRNLFGLAFMLPWLWRAGFDGLKTERLGLYTVRGLVGMLAMLTWFWAVTVMPLGEAVALSFTAPIFATVLAALILRETVRVRRWTATLIGFVGALIILRPDTELPGLPSLIVLVSALGIAGSVVCIKMLSRTEPANAIVTYMAIFMTPMSLIPALFVWTWPSLETLAWLVLIGGTATVAHICVTRAFFDADASAVMPFDFMRLPFTALIAYLAFSEVPDLWTWVGAGVIFSASAYITRREAKLARPVRPATEASRSAPAGS